MVGLLTWAGQHSDEGNAWLYIVTKTHLTTQKGTPSDLHTLHQVNGDMFTDSFEQIELSVSLNAPISIG